MSNILEYLDDTTKEVVKMIVEKYDEDLFELQYQPSEQRCGIGIRFLDIIHSLTKCKIVNYNGAFAIKTIENESHDFKDVSHIVAYKCNRGFIKQVKTIQVINFLSKLYDEGYIIIPDYQKAKSYPSYKGPTNENDQYLPFNNDKINKFIECVYFSHICPTSTLQKFKEVGYKTIEKKRFNCTQICSWTAILVAILIAIFK